MLRVGIREVSRGHSSCEQSRHRKEQGGGLTSNEGLNVKLIEMLQGGLNFEFTSPALNVDQSWDRCKERLQYA